MLNGQPVHSLKGIGEKTGKLFEKLGVLSIDDLLAYYPRAYDTYEAPVPIGQLKDQTVAAVESVLLKGADLVRLNHIQIVSVQLKDMTGSLQVSWYNMPYMRANLKSGETYVFRGRVVKKRGRLVMEQPEVFTPQLSFRRPPASIRDTSLSMASSLESAATSSSILSLFNNSVMRIQLAPPVSLKCFHEFHDILLCSDSI